MKKQLFLIFILFFLLQHGILAGKIKLIKQEACIGIELEKIKNVDFASEDAIYELVKEILPEKLKKWKKTNLKRAAIIFIKHQFNEEVQPSSVEINWYDLDYAMKLIDRKYKTKLSWGFSFSPTLIPRLLGINL